MVTLLESDHDIVGYPVSDLISKDIRTVELASDWLIENLGTVIKNRVFYSIRMQLQLCQIKEREKISIYPTVFTLISQKSEKTSDFQIRLAQWSLRIMHRNAKKFE